MLQRVAIYCGSRMGHDPKYAQAAADLASFLAKQRIGIVYGGSRTGLMGTVADAALQEGGEVIGVVPANLSQREKTHPNLTTTHFVESMHQRKAMMADLADAFVALPGGIGTLDELIEIWCWAKIGDHNKACVCYDVDDFWQPFFDLLLHIDNQGFSHPGSAMLRADSPPSLLTALASHT